MMLKGRKFGGILTEIKENGENRWTAPVGIGLTLNLDR